MDCDGVLNDETEHENAVTTAILEDLAQRTGIDYSNLRTEFNRLSQEAIEQHWSWKPNQRYTSAYAGESIFMTQLAVFENMLKIKYRDAILTDHDDVDDYIYQIYKQVSQSFEKRIRQVASSLLDKLYESDHEVTLVTNSPSNNGWGELTHNIERIKKIGNARKHYVDSDEYIFASGRFVMVDRPHYNQILEDANPGVVVGDTFSLDLSLPAHKRIPIVLVTTPYTSDWAKAATKEFNGVIIDYDQIDQIPELIEEI
jgi:hypothetical protein